MGTPWETTLRARAWPTTADWAPYSEGGSRPSLTVEVDRSDLRSVLAELDATRALLAKVREHILTDRAHMHCPTRPLLEEEER